MIDPRGPRFGAAITFVVLLVALLIGPKFGWIPLSIQVVVFGLGSFLGFRFQPYSLVYRTVVQPRLGPPKGLEDERPPRFAQTVGLLFAIAGVVGSFLDVSWLFYLGTGFALGASFLNWAFNFCLGCELYLLIRKLGGSPIKRLSDS